MASLIVTRSTRTKGFQNRIATNMTTREQIVHALDDIEIEHEYVSDAAFCLLQTILFQRALKNPIHSEREARKLSIRYVCY
jgi:hypothetical protein